SAPVCPATQWPAQLPSAGGHLALEGGLLFQTFLVTLLVTLLVTFLVTSLPIPKPVCASLGFGSS
ncbi:Hypothetical predicted protein, partial [Marmota monax]